MRFISITFVVVFLGVFVVTAQFPQPTPMPVSPDREVTEYDSVEKAVSQSVITKSNMPRLSRTFIEVENSNEVFISYMVADYIEQTKSSKYQIVFSSRKKLPGTRKFYQEQRESLLNFSEDKRQESAVMQSDVFANSIELFVECEELIDTSFNFAPVVIHEKVFKANLTSFQLASLLKMENLSFISNETQVVVSSQGIANIKDFVKSELKYMENKQTEVEEVN